MAMASDGVAPFLLRGFLSQEDEDYFYAERGSRVAHRGRLACFHRLKASRGRDWTARLRLGELHQRDGHLLPAVTQPVSISSKS